MTAKDKLAQKRLTLLQLAEALGNVSKACRMHKVSRSQFYEYKRAFQEFGLSGLIDSKLYTSKKQETTADILYDRVLPFYEEHGLRIETILTDNGTKYKGTATGHLYEIFLDFNDIEHRTTKVATPRTNGFVERFNRTVLDEFFRTAFRKKLYASVSELQADLDVWLHYYNYECPHRGYKNMGRKPIETFEMRKSVKTESELPDTAA